jgi:hypothetical protein
MRAFLIRNAWPWAVLGAGLFCLARGVADLLDQHYAWGSLGIGAGLVLLLTPIPARAAKFDLPREDQIGP